MCCPGQMRRKALSMMRKMRREGRSERLRSSVLQEDAGLLMYYDNALMRAEAQPEQGRLL